MRALPSDEWGVRRLVGTATTAPDLVQSIPAPTARVSTWSFSGAPLRVQVSGGGAGGFASGSMSIRRYQRPVLAVASELTSRARSVAIGRATAYVAATTAALAVVVGAWVTQHAVPAGGPPVPTAGQIVVARGDTMWSIAARVAPARDPRAEVSQLLAINHLTSPDLVPGQVLRVRR